ncbi:hypothetical protein N7G274_004716 [Stereocaulon virgatum]|uniref:Survival Motor Neuron Gemin2-binding domain-containing protein n=1 Tax=Stereocaulon virgatum TaxID=373712 RepID=A0ABR4AAZ2_9LECA
MGKKRKQLSHAEIWDDSALVQSWDDALAEYKLYHSIHARGERVEDVIKDVEAGAQEVALNGDTADNGGAPAQSHDPIVEELEEGELEEEPESSQTYIDIGSTKKNDDKPSSHANPLRADYTNQQQENLGLPNVVIGGVRDEALKNLMMSWYYAGYYTGLYEGQQRAQNNSPS